MTKSASGLVEYARAQLGNPYWWGTYGQIASAPVYANKKNQYPSIYSGYGDCSEDYGKRVHDCVGLVKGYLWSDTPSSTPVYGRTLDVNVAGMYEHCEIRGNIDTIPDIPGICVFMPNLDHIGVYIGNGEVIEAMGHAYGVVKTQLRSRGWKYWGMPEWIDYGDADVEPIKKSETIPTPTAPKSGTYTIKTRILRNGAIGSDVAALQRMLISLKYSCGEAGIDGEFGVCTEQSVRDYQRNHNLEVDGEVGEETMSSLLGIK